MFNVCKDRILLELQLVKEKEDEQNQNFRVWFSLRLWENCQPEDDVNCARAYPRAINTI